MAEFLGVKLSTIYQLTHTGYIPHVKLGRFVRFRELEVLKWIEAKSNKGRLTKVIEIEV
jgi:excisionase family DNA binding protein